MFKSREEAGNLLADLLKKYNGGEAVVLALPRGGVVLGAKIAQKLNLSLDLIISRKIGHPNQPEYAIATVTENGSLIENPEETERIDKDWFKKAVGKEIKEAKRRRKTYLGNRQKTAVKGMTAILVDDGIATGLTIKAAILDLNKRHPLNITIAVPILPQEIANELIKTGVEVVSLQTPSSDQFLGAVGSYYDYFPQVSDEEVIKLLNVGRPPKIRVIE